MALEFTNRAGKTYYLREDKTKTGKPRYFFSRQQDGKGIALNHMPDGYEIYEHPENAQVFLRKKRPQLITDLEKKLIQNHLDQLKRPKQYLMDYKDQYITVYESNADTSELSDVLGDFFNDFPLRPGVTEDDAIAFISNAANQNYSAVLRFCLVDKKKRSFVAERFCFRGSIDDWVSLAETDTLKNLATKYIHRLGTDDFYELPFF